MSSSAVHPPSHPALALSTGLVLILAACGGDAPPTPQTQGDAATTQPASPPALSGGSGSDRGEGTLRLGDATYAFTVRACDVSGDADDDYQTISGVGTTPEGDAFQVFVSRNDIGGMLVHTVSFQTGDVMRGQGTVVEAQRMRHGTAWMSTFDGPAEPLVRIDGNRVTATGRFGSPDGTAAPVDGELEATCG